METVWHSFWKVFIHPFELWFDWTERLSWPYQLTALLVAVIAYYVARHAKRKEAEDGLMKFLFSKEIWLHPSAITDYVFFFINKITVGLAYLAIPGLATVGYLTAANLLAGGNMPPDPTAEASLAVTILATVVAILILDFALWAMHYIFHKVPVLWEFHKVHHSAEVMTPITATRMHPVEEIPTAMISGFAQGVAVFVVDWYFGVGSRLLTIFEINVIVAVFYLAAFNLRHSHVWIRYPNWLQHIFISPAQHHIHHSQARPHWDKNMGFIFAFWDWMFGTLYSPKQREEIVYGLGNGEDGTWRGAGTLFFRPFRQAWAKLNGGRKPADVKPRETPPAE